jgi:hypothetical protein
VIVFNVAKGKIRYYCELPQVTDALVMVPLSEVEFEADLADRGTLSAVLAADSTEQTTLGRKVLTSVTTSQDNFTDTASATAGAGSFTLPTGDTVVAWLICYVPDINAPNDTTTIPLVSLDGTFSPDGNNVNYLFSDDGFWKNG